MSNYSDEIDIRQLLAGVRDRLVVRNKTEAQALVLSTTYPTSVFYTNDTNCIVVNGRIYGRGEQIVASNFAFLPASEPGPGHDPTFQDTTKIYVQPDSSNPGYFKLWWYLQSSSTWINGGSFQLDIPLTAEDISYDLTSTPDLGTGNVQSAIEAEDAKVEQLSLDTMGKDESGEYWEDELHEVYGYSEISRGHRIGSYHGTSQSGYHIFIFPSSEGDVWKVEKAAGAGQWEGFWKGGTNYAAITAANHLQSWSQAAGTFTAPAGTTLFAVVTNTANEFLTTAWKKTTIPAKTPADIQRQLIELENGSINTSALEVGEVMPYWVTNAEIHGKRIEVRKGQVLLLDLVNIAACAPLVFTDKDRIITEIHQTPVYGAFEVPNDGYAYIQKLISHESDNYLYIMGYGGHAKDMANNRVARDELQAQFEALDGKVEQLSLDTLGQMTDGSVEEYWEDMQYEKYHTGYGGQNQNAYISGTNPTSLVYNTSNAVQFFKVEEGEVYHIKGTKAPNTHYKVAFYDSWSPKTGSNGGTISSTFISGIKSTNSSTIQDFKVTVPEGAMMMAIGTVQSNTYKYYQANNTVELYRKVNRQPMSIADKTGYKIEDWTLMSITNTGVIGSKLSFFVTAADTLGKRLEVKAGQVLLLDLVHGSNYPLTFTDGERVITELHASPVKGAYVVPNDGYAYLLNSISHETDSYIYNEGHGGLALYGNPILQDYYNKGLADGAGMASIAGLGYNVYDYISGAINLEGFEYGCRYRHNSIFTPITGTGIKKWQNNTHLVYFPKVDLTGLTPNGYYSFEGCSNLVIVPDLTFSAGSASGHSMFRSCEKLIHVGNIIGFQPTTVLYMFSGDNVLKSVGKIDTSKISASDGFHYIFNSCNVVERCEGLDLTSAPNIGQDTFYYKSNRPTMRYFLLTNLGKNRANTIFNMTRTTNWGVATASQPDARQSVIDTLITYSFDRAQANEDAKQAAIDAGTYDESTWTDPYGVITISLATATKALLTTEEIEQITSKGYTIA